MMMAMKGCASMVPCTGGFPQSYGSGSYGQGYQPYGKGSWEAGKGKGKGKGKDWGSWNGWDEATGWTWKEVGTSIAGTALMGWLLASDEQAESWSTKASQFGSAIGLAASRASTRLMGKVITTDSSPTDERLERLEAELIKIDKEKEELLKQKQ